MRDGGATIVPRQHEEGQALTHSAPGIAVVRVTSMLLTDERGMQ
jgi:hypothetical protein